MRIVIPNQPAGTNLIVKARSKSGADYSEWSRNFVVTTITDNVAPKTPANPVASMAGTSFTLKWDAVTQSADNTPASDLDRYEVRVTSSGSGQTGVYATKDVKFEFSFEQNVNLFGTPQPNVQMAVRALDTAGNASAYSATQSQTNAAPAAPTGLSGTSGVNSLSFSWNAVTDADLKQYRIYSGTSAGSQGTLVWTGTALNANVQVLDSTTDRWYKVVSVDVFGTESATSNVVGPIKPTSPVTVDTTPPAVPTGLAGTLTNAVDGKTASMAVSWTAVADSDLDSYVVAFRQQASPVNDWQYVTVDKATTSTTIQGLVPYKNHDIRIRAKDFTANYSAWATIVPVTAQANTAPATVTGVTATAGKDNLQISWTESTDDDVKNNAGAYEVTVATNSGFSTGVLNYKTAATTLSVNGLASNTTYYVRVRAVDSAGLTSAAWSTSWSGTTSNFSGGSDGAVPVGAPTVTATGGVGYIYLNWTPVTNNDPVVYDVYMSTTSGFGTLDATTKITEVSGTSAFIDTTVGGASLAYGTTYYFKIRARDKDGVSATVSTQVAASPVQATSSDLAQSVNDSITNTQTAVFDSSVERINLATLPAGTSTSIGVGLLGWAPMWYGTGGSGNTTLVTAAPDGPVNVPTYQRKTWTVAPTGNGDTGFYNTSSTAANTWLVTVGETYTISSYIRTSASNKRARIRVQYYDAANAALGGEQFQFGSISSTPYLVPNTWTRLNFTTTAPAGATKARILSDIGHGTGDTLWAPGDTLDGTALLVERGALLGSYFDGSTPSTSSRTYSWLGSVSNSQSKSVNATVSNVQKIVDASDAVNTNPYFSIWPAGNAVPDGWNTWSSSAAAPTRETTTVRTPPNAMRFNCPDTVANYGVSIPASTSAGGSSLAPLPLNLTYVTVTMDVMLVSGSSFSGSGVLFDWAGIDPSTSKYRVGLNLAAEIPTPVNGKWYRVTKVLKKPAGTNPHTSWNAFLMANYGYMGQTGGATPLTVKDIIFDSLSFRPSTAEEISAYNAAPLSTVTDLTAQVNSKGTDLVTNGNGLLGNNYNFSVFNYNGADAPVGANGSFVTKTTANASHMIDELIPFDPFKKYKFSFQARQTVTGNTNTLYGFIVPYDAAGNPIYPEHYMYVQNTTTTLAVDLKPGDTTITLTDSTNWYGSAGKPANTATYLRGITVWNYVDANGRAWGNAYTRNVWRDLWNDGGITGNVITLKTAWPAGNGTIPAGTSLSNSTSGGNYLYLPTATNVVVPETWTAYSDTYNGVGIFPTASQAVVSTGAATWSTGVPAATAKIKVGWLLNYPAATTGKHAIAAVSFSDAQAAQATADAVKTDLATNYSTTTAMNNAIATSANGKNKTTYSASAPGSAPNTAGDTWFQQVSNQIMGQWVGLGGTSWQAVTLRNEVIANLDAAKIVAGSTFTQALTVKSTFTLGDAGTPGIIKSYDYVANTTGFSLSSAGLQINNGDIDAKTLRANTSFVNTLLVGTGGAVQSTNFSSTNGFQLSTNGLIIRGAGNTVEVGALSAGTITGKAFIIGTGGSFTVDQTGVIKSNNYAAGSTGYQLSNTGLEVNDGSIDAKVLKTNTAVIGDLTIGRSADAVGTLKSYDYASGTTGWKIGKGLFEINQGTIKAAALQIQDSQNIVPAQFAAFEFSPSFYTGGGLTGASNSTWSVQTTGGKFGPQYLRLTATTGGGVSAFPFFGTSSTDYNIPVEPGETYIVSGYLRSNLTSLTNLSLRLRGNDGNNLVAVAPGAGSLSSTTWNRFAGAVTIPAGVTSAIFTGRVDWTTAGDYVEFDGLQVERKTGGLNTASPWTMPGSTSIDGAMLRTGQAQSNSNVTVNGVLQPAWSINMAGGAQFGNAAVRGTMVVGPTTVTNVVPNNGDFENAGTALTGLTLFNVAGSGVTMTRTTTAGELITGTGSLKFAWTTPPLSVGFKFDVPTATFPNGITAGNVLSIQMKVRGKTASGTGSAMDEVKIDLLDAGGNTVTTVGNMLPTPTFLPGDGTVLTINQSFVLPDSAAPIKSMWVYGYAFSGSGTMLIFDDVSITTSDDLGASYISSGNYQKNTRGWKISSGGQAEFNNITLRGAFQTTDSGTRWQIGTTPQWYGSSADMVAYSGSVLESAPATISAYGGGIRMSGAEANNLTIPHSAYVYVGNQQFLSTEPNLAYGSATVSAGAVSIQAMDGLASDGVYYGSQVSLTADPDAVNPGSSHLKIRSEGADGDAKVDVFSNGYVDIWSYQASGTTNPRGIRLDTDDPAWALSSNSNRLYLLTDRIELSSGQGMASLQGNVFDQMMWNSRAVDMLTGGGVLTVDTSFNVKWSQRFLVTAIGRGNNLYTDYLAISMPSVGTVIPGYGGASNVTVTSSGVPIPSWCCLWYEPTFGGLGSTTDNAGFRITTYTADFTVPAHWIPLAIRNNDLSMIYFGNGVGYTPWYDVPLTGWTVYDAAGTGYRQPQYRRTSFNEVQLRGVVKHATTTTTGVLGTALPVGFRPSESEMFGLIANNGIARVNVESSGLINVVAYGTGASGAWISLSGVSYYAD